MLRPDSTHMQLHVRLTDQWSSDPNRAFPMVQLAVIHSSAWSMGDISSFRVIEIDTLQMVNANNLAGAKARVDDLEIAWDQAEAHLKPRNPTKWKEVDGTIDTVLHQLRATHQDPAACKAALEASLAALQ